MQCGSCSKQGAKSTCSVCLEEAYCGAECQKKAWGDHKRVCLPKGPLQQIARAIEVAALGSASKTSVQSMKTLSRCFKQSEGSADPGKIRLATFLSAMYICPVVRLEDDCFVAFAPQVATGVYTTRDEALQSLKPFIEATKSRPKVSPSGLDGSGGMPMVLSYSDWVLIALIVARYSEPMRSGGVGLMPEDFQRPNNLPRKSVDPEIPLAIVGADSKVEFKTFGEM